jgi:hypothetical protein
MSLSVELDNLILENIRNNSIQFAIKCIEIVSKEYNLDKEKVLKLLNLENTNVVQKQQTRKTISDKSISDNSVTNKEKRKDMPIPYTPSMINENGCHGIIYNYGLFTQCENVSTDVIGVNKFCKTCVKDAESNGGIVPKCGTIHSRKEQNMFEYKDTKGRKSNHYLKVLEKLNIDKSIALEYLKTFDNKELIQQFHYKENQEKSKRGRPRKQPCEVIVNKCTDEIKTNIASSTKEVERKQEIIERKQEIIERKQEIVVEEVDDEEVVEEIIVENKSNKNNKEKKNKEKKINEKVIEKLPRKQVDIDGETYFIGQSGSERFKVFNKDNDHIGTYNHSEGEIELFEDDSELEEEEYN